MWNLDKHSSLNERILKYSFKHMPPAPSRNLNKHIRVPGAWLEMTGTGFGLDAEIDSWIQTIPWPCCSTESWKAKTKRARTLIVTTWLKPNTKKLETIAVLDSAGCDIRTKLWLLVSGSEQNLAYKLTWVTLTSPVPSYGASGLLMILQWQSSAATVDVMRHALWTPFNIFNLIKQSPTTCWVVHVHFKSTWARSATALVKPHCASVWPYFASLKAAAFLVIAPGTVAIMKSSARKPAKPMQYNHTPVYDW